MWIEGEVRSLDSNRGCVGGEVRLFMGLRVDFGQMGLRDVDRLL